MSNTITPSNPLAENPYVGPRTFTRQQANRFFGREREARELLAIVTAERLTLFYAQSGAGKSSLINTRLAPGLEAKGFEVLPVGRVGGNEISGSAANPFVLTLMRSLLKNPSEGEQVDNLTLADFLARLVYLEDGCHLLPLAASEPQAVPPDDAAPPIPRVLIIDQFEEVLTNHLAAWQQRGDFFDQLADALAADPYLWVVLTLREDYVAGLDPYAHRTPNGLRARYQMRRMGIEAALDAVKRPADEIGHRPFAPGVAEQLVNNLRLVQNTWSDNAESALIQGEFVEPVQLQVVCWQLWQGLAGKGDKGTRGQGEGETGGPGDKETRGQGEGEKIASGSSGGLMPNYITESDLRRLAGDRELPEFVNQALARYYVQALEQVVQLPDLDIGERQVRDWFSTRLITSEGTRSLVHQGDASSGAGGLPAAAVRLLADLFLIRAENRAGGIWYELVHDRFVQPILQANREWLQRQNNPIMVAMRPWLTHNRDPKRLLSGPLLADAQRFAQNYPNQLGAEERAFLQASEQAEEEAQAAARERQLQAAQERTWWTQRIAAVLGALLCVAVVAVIAAFYQRGIANQQSTITRALLLANNAQIKADAENDTALLLGAEAYRRYDSPETRSPLLHATERNYEPQLAILRGHTDQVWGSAFSPDGTFIATASLDSSVQLWDPIARQPIRRLVSPKVGLSLFRVAVSHQYIAAGARGGYVLIWDVHTGELVKTLSAHDESVFTLAFSPDERSLATGGADTTVRITDLTTWQTKKIGKHGKEKDKDSWVWDVAYSPDGRTLASASRDKTVRLWDLDPHVGITATVVLTEHNAIVTSLAFHPSLTITLLVSGDAQGKMIFWDLNPWRSGRHRPPHSKPRQKHAVGYIIWAMDFSPDGRLLASASSASTFRYWTVDSSRPIKAMDPQLYSLFLDGHTAALADVEFSPDGKSTVVASWDGTASLWGVSSGNLLYGQSDKAIQSLALSKDEQTLYAASEDGFVRAWDTSQRALRWAIPITQTPAIKLRQLSSDGSLLATTDLSGTISLWSVESAGVATLQHVLPSRHQTETAVLAFNPDDDRLATGDKDGVIYLWDTQTGVPSEPLVGHTKEIHALTFSADGELLASSSCGNEPVCFADVVRTWDVRSGQPVGDPLPARQGYASALAFSSDKTTLASGSTDARVLVWDLKSRQESYTHKQHTAGIRTLAFSPNNQLLASGGVFGTVDDRTGSIILWDVARSIRFGRSFNEHDGAVAVLLFSRDGKTLYSGGDNGYIVINDLRVERWLERACQLANRNLSAREWRIYVGEDQPYRRTCPQWPDGEGIVNDALP